MKRLLDMAIILVLAPFWLPVFVVIYFLVRANLGTPVFFCQQRPGRYGKIFSMYKFRSMQTRVDENGQLLPDQLRLTRFGGFLRASSLDELPELWSVWKGDMSLVGPRPLLVEYLGLYSTEQARRHDVLPGITGWAQINGRNAISWEEKFRLDVWYVDNRTLWLDIKILLLTVKKVLKREGINSEGHVTAEPFRGTK